MRAFLFLLPALQLSCSDETISGYADPQATYRLVEIAGTPFYAQATISFPEKGAASGEGPCNSWSAKQTAPYPWIKLGPIAATRRACIALSEEQTFFQALAKVSLAETQGDILLLTDEDGATMIFTKIP